MAVYRIDNAAVRHLALTVNLYRLAHELGVSRPTLYRYLAGKQSNDKMTAERVAANIDRLRKRATLPDIVAAAINRRANGRISVRSSTKGPFTRHEILRYPLGQIEQRYDATTQTLLIRQNYLYDILRKSCHIPNPKQARADLLRHQLITPVNPQPNLAYGASLPHRHVDSYLLDLTRIEWSALRITCQLSATYSDPEQSAIVLPWRITRGNHAPDSPYALAGNELEQATVNHSAD